MREILSQRIDCPLPVTAGVQDCRFYFVPRTDVYRKQTPRFFGTIYRRHVEHDVHGLETTVNVLPADVTTGGVSTISGVVIVPHSNAEALLLQLLRNPSWFAVDWYRYTQQAIQRKNDHLHRSSAVADPNAYNVGVPLRRHRRGCGGSRNKDGKATLSQRSDGP